MKNLIIHLMKSMLLVIILASVSKAQVKFGAWLGVTSSNLSFEPEDPDPPLDAKTDFTLGGILEYPLNDNLNLRSGASLTNKGAQSSEEFPGGVEAKLSLNISYLTVPILAQYKLNTSSTTPYLISGLDIGILLSAEEEISISGPDMDDITVTEDVKDDLSSTDLALNIGGGYMMEMGNAKVYGELLYSLGLVDINESDNKTIKTNGFIIGVGYIF